MSTPTIQDIFRELEADLDRAALGVQRDPVDPETPATIDDVKALTGRLCSVIGKAGSKRS